MWQTWVCEMLSSSLTAPSWWYDCSSVLVAGLAGLDQLWPRCLTGHHLAGRAGGDGAGTRGERRNHWPCHLSISPLVM